MKKIVLITSIFLLMVVTNHASADESQIDDSLNRQTESQSTLQSESTGNTNLQSDSILTDEKKSQEKSKPDTAEIEETVTNQKEVNISEDSETKASESETKTLEATEDDASNETEGTINKESKPHSDQTNNIKQDNMRESHPSLSQNVIRLEEAFNQPIGDLPGIDSSGKFLNITDRNGQLGAIWGKYKLDLKYNFTLDSYMYFGNKLQKAADGMTFTLQNTGPKAIGGGGQELGAYGPYMNGISIEFDTYHNSNGLDSDLPIHDTYDHTAFFDIRNRRHLKYRTVFNSSKDDQLSAGFWYKIRVSWTASNKELRYQLQALNNNDNFESQDESLTLDTNNLFGEEYPSVWWGYTGATGEQWTTNTLAFQTLPQPSNQDVSLEVRGTESEDISAYDQDIITLKVKRNALYNLWADVNTTIDYSKAANMLTYIPDSLEVNGKKVTPSSQSNGKITLPKTSIDKTSDLVTLKFKGKYINYDKKAIKVNTTGTEHVSLSDGTGLSYLDGSEDTVNVKVKPDLISIDAKDTTINIDDKWQSKDNFVSATNEDGNNVDFSSSKISVTPNTLDTSKAGKYKINYKYEGILKKVNKEATVTVYDNRPLKADPIPQEFSLGSDLSQLKASELIKNVRKGNEAVKPDGYQLSLTKLPDSNLVGKKEAIVKITRKANDISSEIKIPIEINWGNSLKLNGNDLQTIMALTTHKSAIGYSVIATRAQLDKNTDHIQPQIKNEYVKIDLAHAKSESLTNLKPYYETSLKGTDEIDTAYQKFVRQEAAVGDIVKVSHKELTNGSNYIGRFNEDSWNPPSGFLNTDAYFEISDEGKFLDIKVNQLSTKEVSVPIYATKEDLNIRLQELVDLKGYSNIKIKEFSEYPSTTNHGKQKGKVIVEETLLTSSKKVQYEYDVIVNVEPGTLEFSVPKTLTFNDFSKSPKEQVVNRKYSGGLGLEVKDSRGGKEQGKWRVTAQVKGSNEPLAEYLIFRNPEKVDTYLNNGEVTIFTGNHQDEPTEPLEVELSEKWKKDDGVLLKIPAKNKLLGNKTYQETIYWNLVEGP